MPLTENSIDSRRGRCTVHPGDVGGGQDKNVLARACPAFLSILITLGLAHDACRAVADAAPAETAAEAVPPPPQEGVPAASAFQPQDISIGEPISLPFAAALGSPPAEKPVPPPMAAPERSVLEQPGSRSPGPGAAGPRLEIQQRGGPAIQSDPMAHPSAQAGFPAPKASVPAAGDAATAGSGWLGITADDSLITGRLVVVEVAPNGPAARAAVMPQDVLLAIDGKQLRTDDELAAALAAISPGQRVTMTVGRENRVEEVVAEAAARPLAAQARDWQSAPPPASSPPASSRFDVAPMPASAAPRFLPSADPAAIAPSIAAPLPTPANAEPPIRPASPSPSGRTALGVRTVPVDPAMQSRFGLAESQGAFVIGVVHDLPASKAGVPPGSVIVAINHQPVRSPQDLTQLVARGPVGTPVPLQYVLPGGQARQAEVVLQSLEQPLERALLGDESSRNESSRADEPALSPQAGFEPPSVIARRVQQAVASKPSGLEPLQRLEDLLQRVNNRLEQIERRLDRIDRGR